MLRRVTITGETKYSDQFTKFFAIFGSTIESLTLNIVIEFNRLDGSDLEHDLLDKMPRLSSFDFHIDWRSSAWKSEQTIDISKFQSVTLQKFNPVFCWIDITYRFGGIYNLPYKFSYFYIASNDFTSSYVTNRSVRVCFESVDTLEMGNGYQWWNMETFDFIRNAFPNIKTLALMCILDDEDWSFYPEFLKKRRPEIFSDDLRTNTLLQLPSGTTVCLNIEYFQYNNATLRCLFHLLPNLTTIKTNNMEKARGCLESRGYFYDDFVRDALARMKFKRLNVPYDPYDIIKPMFPFGDREY